MKDSSDGLSLTLYSAYQTKNEKPEILKVLSIRSFTYKPVWLIINAGQTLNVTVVKLFGLVTEESFGKLKCNTLGLNSIIKSKVKYFS